MKPFDIPDLKLKCLKIDDEILKIDSLEKTGSLRDGIINIELYNNSKCRILWILRDPYDDFEDDGNPIIDEGWDYKKALNDDLYKFKKIRTWQKIAYVSYGILNNCFYKDIKQDSINFNSTFESIKNIAFINIKKIPGRTGSLPDIINDAYVKNKNILLNQIKTYNPNVIIGGGTMPHFLKDLDLENCKRTGHELKYYIKERQLFIDAYHPSNRGATEDYVDQIVSVVKDSWDIIN